METTADLAAIDAHSHVWTPDNERYPLAAGYTPAGMQPTSFTANELLAHAQPCGVNRIVLIQMSFYGYDNSYLLDCIRERPSVFSGIAQVDVQGAAPSAEMKRLKQLGVRGVRIRPTSPADSGWLDETGMGELWQGGADLGMTLCPLIDPDQLPSIDRMCQAFPETPVVVDHCARIGGDGSIREQDVAALCRLARHRRTHVKLSAFYYLGAKQPPYDDLGPFIRRLCDAFGPQRLLWGSDCPYQAIAPHHYAASIDLIRERLGFLNSADKMWILRRTAEQLFFT